MALDILAQGKLVKAPEQRTGASGKPYMAALLSVAIEGDESLLASCVAFRPEAVAALLALAKDDAVAVAGRAKLNAWADKATGEAKHGLSVVVEQVLTPYHVRRRRYAVAAQGG
jgi:single-stranded DNA-binding protein